MRFFFLFPFVPYVLGNTHLVKRSCGDQYSCFEEGNICGELAYAQCGNDQFCWDIAYATCIIEVGCSCCTIPCGESGSCNC